VEARISHRSPRASTSGEFAPRRQFAVSVHGKEVIRFKLGIPHAAKNGRLPPTRGLPPPFTPPLLSELRRHERQAAEELERWKTHHEEDKVIDASPAAITLALLLTDEGLDSLENGKSVRRVTRKSEPPSW
jgi:hypothetical protein